MDISHSNAPRPGNRRAKRPWPAIVVVFALVVVVINLVGYLIYRQRSQPDDAKLAAVAASDPTSVSALAREQRQKGVEALRAGSYDVAIASFDVALRLDPELEDVSTLREVAQRLKASVPDDEPRPKVAKGQTKGKAVAQLAPSPPPEVAEPAPPPPRAPPRRSSRRSRSTRSAPPPPTPEPPRPAARVEVAARAIVSTPPPEPEVAIEAPEDASPEISVDERLDLVALVDRDAPVEDRTTSVEVAPPAPKKETTLRPTPTGAAPRLVVFWPGRSSATLSRALTSQMGNVDVRIYSRTSALREGLKDGVDAVMASPSVLRSKGLSPRMTGTGGFGGAYVAVDLTGGMTTTKLSTVKVGVVDELGRKGMPALVAKLIGGSAPKLRRVTKVEDLLPLLQFDIVQAVIVRRSDLAALESRTQQKLFTIPLSAHREPLAVAFVAGGRGAAVERAVRGLSTDAKKRLGVDSWR